MVNNTMKTTNNMTKNTTNLHEYAHDTPAVVGPTLREGLVQPDSCVLLLLVVSYSHVGHEEMGQDLLVLGIVRSSACIHFSYLHV